MDNQANTKAIGEQWLVQSNCHYCGYLCGFNATVEQTVDGQRLVDLAPDPTRYPYDQSITRACRRWQMNLTEIDGAGRINYPLRRVGERGSGQWERIGWDQALNEIAKKLSKLAEQHGPQTLASAIGGPHGVYWPLHRFMNLWGSPNNMGIGQICWNIRIWMDALAYGWPIEVNIDPAVTEQVFLWGTNPAQSDNSLFWRTLLRMRKDGMPIVVVDPRKTGTAGIASLHLAPRPGTDCTLALAIIRWIIDNKRYDHEFVKRWCHGFDELVQHVQPYTLEHAEQVAGVAAADIAAAAELFSRPGPSALLSGRGVDQLGPNTAPTHRALSILRAITGDVDRPGACYIMDISDFTPEVDLEMSAALTAEARATQLNEGFSALQSYSGYQAATKLTARLGRTDANPLGKRLPMRYLASAHPNLVWRSVLGEWPEVVGGTTLESSDPCATAEPKLMSSCGTRLSTKSNETQESVDDKLKQSSDSLINFASAAPESLDSGTVPLSDSCDVGVSPYRVTALICMAANPLVTYADTKLVYRALKSLELLVVLEYYMTPTAQLADYVLPSAGAFERPQFQAHGGVSNFCYGGAAAVEPYYERHTDYDFFRGLGMRLGQQEHWPWPTLKDAIEATMQVAGVDWESWTERGIYYNKMTFSKQEILCENLRPQGFATTTGKLELTNELLDKLGAGRLPVPVGQWGRGSGTEGGTEGTGRLSHEPQWDRRPVPSVPPSVPLPRPHCPTFPLTLITGARMQPYWASSYFNNSDFRESHPYPTAQMSAITLEQLGIASGQWVVVETARGSAQFMAEEAEMVDGVVSCEYGWWYPEAEQGEPHLGGIWRSNVNLLTSADIEDCEPLIGSWNYNDIPCRVMLAN
ncbi:hypothetical protein FACS1894104_2380 [Actinomycetota bacterium]|nr:hypothetical protein FACS1894104_2380 [Actinomycetota bacterium]